MVTIRIDSNLGFGPKENIAYDELMIVSNLFKTKKDLKEILNKSQKPGTILRMFIPSEFAPVYNRSDFYGKETLIIIGDIDDLFDCVFTYQTKLPQISNEGLQEISNFDSRRQLLVAQQILKR